MHRSKQPVRRTAIPTHLRIQLHRQFTERRFEQFESYGRQLEGMFKRQVESFNVRIEAKLKNMPESQRQDFVDSAAEDYAELHETFPEMFRASLFVMCMADFEHTLNGLAELFQNVKKLEISFKDLRGEGMDRARLYLKKVAKVGFPDDSPLWPKIKEFSALRNIIVHADGRVSKGHKDEALLKGLIASLPGKLRLDRFQRLVPEQDFIPHVLDILRRFHSDYADALRKRYRISRYST